PPSDEDDLRERDVRAGASRLRKPADRRLRLPDDPHGHDPLRAARPGLHAGPASSIPLRRPLFGRDRQGSPPHPRPAHGEILGQAACASQAADRLSPRLWGSGIRLRLREAALVAGLRLAILAEVLPILGSVVGAATLLGLLLRERIREGRAFASPIQAYLG